MEMFGLLFSVPVTLVAFVIYTSILKWGLTQWPSVRPFLLWPAVFVIACQLIEVVLITIFGVVRSQDLLGSLFYPTHLVLFLTSTPSLATVLTIWGRDSWFGKRRFVAPLCALLAFSAVLLQYAVAESLVGIARDPQEFGALGVLGG